MKEQKMNEPNVREELEGVAPVLAKLKDESDGFQVPDQYFVQLQEAVAQEIGLNDKPEPSPSWLDQTLASLQWLFRPKLAMAMASLAILLLAAIWVLKPNDSSTADSMELLSYEEIEGYIQQNIDAFDLDLLMEYTQVEGTSPGIFSDENLPDNAEFDQYMDEIIDDLDVADLQDLL